MMTMPTAPFWHLRNLGTSGCVEGPWPWEFTTPPPDKARGDKKWRDAWASSPLTEHHAYAVAWGLNPRQRVSKATRSGEGNPPHTVWGFAADFDSPYTPADVLGRIPEHAAPFVPSWYERTLSGNARLVWLFERPILVPGFNFTAAFLALVAERVRASALLAGLDFKASTNPSRYFTNSGEWHAVPGGALVPIDVVEGWVVETGRTFKFERDTETKGDVVGGLEAIRDALAARYPKFSEWPGDFVEGAMGPTFWIPESASPKSATVRAGGMQTFSAHASRAWYSWADLLDKVVVQGLQSASLGGAVRDIYWDEQQYWVPDRTTGSWMTIGRENIDTYLILRRGCSRKPQENGVSRLDEAKLHIAESQRVANVGHAVCHPPGVIRGADGQPMLNISTRTVMAPAEELGMVWGPTGKFPFLSGFYEAFLPDETSRNVWLAILSHAYSGAYNRRPGQGQCIFFCGPPSVGKTMHTSAILNPLFGGCADAGPYILGRDSFGGELFENFLLRADDNGLFVDARTRAVSTERIKALVANSEQRVNVKFKMPQMAHWLGRLICTANDDPDSLSALPELTSSLEGKVCFFRTGAVPYSGLALGREYVADRIAAELAYFARWLLEHPPKSFGVPLDPRFGVAAYHDPSLVVETRAQSGTALVRDLLDDWRTETRADGAAWRGTIARLRMAISDGGARSELLRQVPVDRFRRDVLKLASSGTPWLRVDGDHIVVSREDLTSPLVSGILPPPPAMANGTTYGKTQS